MLGRAHALSGAAVWLAGAPALTATTDWFTLSPETWALGAVVCAGAALTPDLDTPGRSSASNAFKPITTLLSNIVSAVSFGHRKATHSILGMALFAALMWALTGALAPVGALVAVFLLTTFACKALGFNLFRYIPIPGSQGFATLATGALMVGATWWISAGNYDWVFWAGVVGYIMHVVPGDMITRAGVPLLWPIDKDFRLSPMKAGGPTELFIITPVLLAVIAVSVFLGVSQGQVFGHGTGTSTVMANEQPDTYTDKPVQDGKQSKNESKKKTTGKVAKDG